MRIATLAAAFVAGVAPSLAEPLPPPGASSCSGCHGTAAGSPVPPLRGRAPDEVAAAMRAFRTGERPATVMGRIAKGFTDDETRAIAAWLGRQP